MERIPIQWWQAFVVFRESADMTEAARKLGLTQPALSKQLKSLQSRVGQPLLRGEGKRRVPTEYGEALYVELQKRFAGLEEDVRDVTLRHLQGAPPRVRIHGRREVLDRLIAGLSTKSTLVLHEAGHAEIRKAIEARATDIAIDHLAPDSDQWIARPLFVESFEVWIPKSFLPRRPSEERGWEALQDLPVVAYREHDELLEQAAVARGLDPRRLRISGITGNYQSLREWVRAGRGWAVLPAYLAEDPGVWRLPIPARTLPSREFFAIYRREHAKARWLRETLTEIQGAFRS
ncbi:MAG: LysR family transcriptional regulator [Bdellovibrionaceae bacterium]|nr:LysR family transcriptional regulator [Pseudobdellovibrionaceae bacterium]